MNRARRDLRRVLVASPLLLLALGATAGAGAAPASVAVGGVPALAAGATSLGGLASTAPLRLTVVLAPRDPAGLAARATAVSTPGSPLYHRYLGVGQFAARFGASADAVAAVRATLGKDGLTPGALAPDGLSIAVSGTALQASQAFAVSLRRYREGAGRQVYANTTAPRLPAALGGVVQDVLGLDDVQAAAPASLRRRAVPPLAHTASGPFTGGVGPAPCPAASSGTGPSGPYTVDQVARAYGMGGLYAGGDRGAGVTVALYELEPYATSDLSAFQSCFGTAASVTNIPVDGGPGSSGPGSGETALDLDNVIGVAPSSRVEVYQGPNAGAGVYDTFARIVNDNTAQVISDSWGLCEPQTPQAELSAENTLFQQAAVQGQSILVAAGDSGSSGCGPPGNVPAVDDAASQPFATGVGGTTLSTLGPPAGESVWNDGSGAAGGGISGAWTMPPYQSAHGAINGLSSAVPCGASSGYCREVPDVSADAAPSTGYQIYWNGGWLPVGGTSAAAPLWAGLTALAEASVGSPGCAGKMPLGFLNPQLYSIAVGANGTHAFADVTTGNNNPSHSGPYPAAAGYDMASGLGTPIATDATPHGLVAQLCANDPAITTPPSVRAVNAGAAPPGTTVTIDGSGFTANATVWFGTVPASNVVLLSFNQLSATVPAGRGSVHVTVTTANGFSTATPADLFAYPPTATISVPGAGATYTQTQPVAAAYSCAAAAPGAPACTAPVPNASLIDTSTTGLHSFTVTATDSNALSAQQTVTYNVVPPPVATISTPANGARYTQGQTVGAAYTCAASTAGPASCVGTLPAGSAIDTSSTGARRFTVTAADANGVSATQAASYTIVARPQVTITVPAAGATYTLGAAAAASFACGAGAPLAIASCASPVPAGARIDTSSIGPHSFTVTADDTNGVTTSRTVAYTVAAARPTITALRQAASRWLERRSAASRLPVGTRFSFSLDQAATITFRFMRSARGRIVGGRCVAAGAANRRAPRCRRTLSAGTVRLRASAGATTRAFSGVTSRGPIAPGSYTVLVSAVGASGQRSAIRSLHFMVARSTAS